MHSHRDQVSHLSVSVQHHKLCGGCLRGSRHKEILGGEWRWLLVAVGVECYKQSLGGRDERLPPLDIHYSNPARLGGDRSPPQQPMKKGSHTSSWQQRNPHIASSKQTHTGDEYCICQPDMNARRYPGNGKCRQPYSPSAWLNCGFPGKFSHRKRGPMMLSCVVLLNLSYSIKVCRKARRCKAAYVHSQLFYTQLWGLLDKGRHYLWFGW